MWSPFVIVLLLAYGFYRSDCHVVTFCYCFAICLSPALPRSSQKLPGSSLGAPEAPGSSSGAPRSYQKLPNAARSSPGAPQELSEAPRELAPRELPEASKHSQKLPKAPGAPRSSPAAPKSSPGTPRSAPKLPKALRSYQKLPEALWDLPEAPEVPLPEAPEAVKSSQKLRDAPKAAEVHGIPRSSPKLPKTT